MGEAQALSDFRTPPEEGDFSAFPEEMQEIIHGFSKIEGSAFIFAWNSFFKDLNPDALYRFLKLDKSRRFQYYYAILSENGLSVYSLKEEITRELLHPGIARKIQSLEKTGEELHIFGDSCFPFLALSLRNQWIYLSVDSRLRKKIYERFHFDDILYFWDKEGDVKDDEIFSRYTGGIKLPDFIDESDAQVTESEASENGIVAVGEAVRDVAAEVLNKEDCGSRLDAIVKEIGSLGMGEDTKNFSHIQSEIFDLLKEAIDILSDEDISLPEGKRTEIIDILASDIYMYILGDKEGFIQFFQSRDFNLLVDFFILLKKREKVLLKNGLINRGLIGPVFSRIKMNAENKLQRLREKHNKTSKKNNLLDIFLSEIYEEIFFPEGQSKRDESKRGKRDQINRRNFMIRLEKFIALLKNPPTPPTPTPQSETHQAS